MTILRCAWGNTQDELVQQYHDHEWGKLNLDANYLYEMLVLELFQSGLSWSTILHKRANFQRAFKNFDVGKVAQMTEKDVQELMNDASIIRNQRKIRAAIHNAQTILKINQKYDSFAKYLQSFVPTPIVHHPETDKEVLTQNEISQNMAKQMKKDGFSFVGPVIIYSYLQAIGLINDHVENCNFKFNG